MAADGIPSPAGYDGGVHPRRETAVAFKDILVHVDSSGRSSERLKVAASLARTHGAHLVGLYVRWRPDLPPAVAVQLAPDIAAIQALFNENAEREARAAFDAVAPGTGVTCEWRAVDGTVAEAVPLHARYADLTVIGQAADWDDDRHLADALVLAVGRPVLAVPYAGRFDTVGQRVLVAWNGSREATRAVHDALPLLKSARRVTVLAVNPDDLGPPDGMGDLPGADLCLHLARHGVNAVCQQVQADDLEVGALLLSRAADEDADLLVMGAYGRSRLSERVLGGATRHVLRHMTVPVLLSH